MYFVNAIFHVLHVGIILSSVLMCFFEGLIVFHLWLQATILSSWLIIGPIVNKPGMCLLTEIQKKMGLSGSEDFPHSYMVYLFNKFGYQGNDTKKIDMITFSVFSVCTSVSLLRYLY